MSWRPKITHIPGIRSASYVNVNRDRTNIF